MVCVEISCVEITSAACTLISADIGSDYNVINSDGAMISALPFTIHLSSNNKNDSFMLEAVDDNIVEATLETLSISISVSSTDINTMLGPAQSDISIDNTDGM